MRTVLRAISVSLITMFAVAFGTPARAVLINFDAPADGTVIDTYYFNPLATSVSFSNPNPIGGGPPNVYARGSIFNTSPGNVVSVLPTGFPPFNAFYGAVDGTLNRVLFDQILTVTVMAAAVATLEPLGTPQNRPFMQAWDQNNVLLPTVYFQGALPTNPFEVTSFQRLTISVPPCVGTPIQCAGYGISKVRFSSQQSQPGPPIYALFDDFQWNPAVCSAPVITNGNGSSCAGTINTDTCTSWTCDVGYTPQGSNPVCSNGSWTGTYSCEGDGWTSDPGTQPFGAEVHDGIVHLRGALRGGSTPVLFTLPISMRPATMVYVEADLCSGVQGRLNIFPSGDVQVESTTSFADAQCRTSLEGVKFAPSETGFTPLTLANGWVGAPFATSAPAAAKINGIVHLKGALSSGVSEFAFTLPPEMRPATDVYIPINLFAAAKGRLYIQPNGSVFALGLNSFADAQGFTSLDGVSFAPSTSGFAPLSLVSGWFGAPFGTSGAAASIHRNVVYLKGAIGGGSDSFMTTLPPILRPEGFVYLPLDLCNANKGLLEIWPSGQVFVGAPIGFSQAQCFTSLDGVSYVVPEPSGFAALVSGVLLLVGIRGSRARRGRSSGPPEASD